MPKEESFLIPLEYIGVVKWTNTTLDVLLKSRIDHFGNVDGDRNLPEPWTVFSQFTILNAEWSSARLTKIQATSRPEHSWPEIWSGMSKAAQRKEKQHRAIEKPKRVQKVGVVYGFSHASQGAQP